jgi:hypothetical protein
MWNQAFKYFTSSPSPHGTARIVIAGVQVFTALGVFFCATYNALEGILHLD